MKLRALSLAIALWLGACVQAQAAVAFVSNTGGISHTGTTTTSVVGTITGGANRFVLCLAASENLVAGVRTVTGMTDTNSALTFTKLKGISDAHVTLSSDVDLEAWVAPSSAQTTETITVQWSGTFDNSTVQCQEWSGVSTANPLDPNANAFKTNIVAAASTPTVSGVSTTEADVGLLTVMTTSNTLRDCSGAVCTNGAGFTFIVATNSSAGTNFSGIASQYEIVAAPQSGVSEPFAVTTTIPNTITMALSLCGSSNGGGCAASSTVPLPGPGAGPFTHP